MLAGQFDVHYVCLILTGRKLMLTVLASVIISVFVLGDNLQMCFVSFRGHQGVLF